MNKLWYKKRSSLHGSGLFAATNIKNKEQVIQYIGDKVTKKEGDKRADIQLQKAEKNKKTGMVYVFELNKNMILMEGSSAIMQDLSSIHVILIVKWKLPTMKFGYQLLKI